MNLTDQEKNMGLIIVRCKCCASTYKTHGRANALPYGLTPGYGCSKCQGVVPDDLKAKLQRNACNITISVSGEIDTLKG